jgi:hypothetical protein
MQTNEKTVTLSSSDTGGTLSKSIMTSTFAPPMPLLQWTGNTPFYSATQEEKKYISKLIIE